MDLASQIDNTSSCPFSPALSRVRVSLLIVLKTKQEADHLTEGFTADTLGRLISTTILNPVLTLPLLLLLRYTSKGTAFALLHETLVRRLRYAFYVGAFRWVSSWLSDQAANNWTSDTYHWRDQSVGALGKEIVLVTGGSDGIGKQVVLLLAEHARTVIVLDVQPLNFDARKFPCSPCHM